MKYNEIEYPSSLTCYSAPHHSLSIDKLRDYWYTKNGMGVLPVTRPMSKGSGIAHQSETSNAEAHACMHIQPSSIKPKDFLQSRYEYYIPMSVIVALFSWLMFNELPDSWTSRTKRKITPFPIYRFSFPLASTFHGASALVGERCKNTIYPRIIQTFLRENADTSRFV